ncbi:MAG: hemin uptake protein HemP [Rhizobiales bacterium]|nr:hemin uptake protein HemP [Hyphomicrobiales bacterium]
MRKEAETTEIANQSGTSASQLRKIDVVSNRIESRDLFVATKEITIGHEGEVYRLRLTALNKLILTK